MKLTFTLTLILTQFILNTANSQSYFQKSYYREGTAGFGGQQTSDGGYIIYGRAQTFPFPVIVDMTLIKTDSKGDTLWTRLFGEPQKDEMTLSARQTYDQGYILTGINGDIIQSAKLQKTDNAGNLVWWKDYLGQSGHCTGYSVIQTPDSGYLLMGGVSDSTVFLIKTDVSGNVIWSRSCDTDSLRALYERNLLQTADGNFIFTGYFSNPYAINKPITIIKFDINGDTIWTKTYSTTYGVIVSSIKQTLDGGYVIAGRLIEQPNLNTFISVLRIDSTGNILWSKKYNNSSNFNLVIDVICKPDGSFLVCGANGGHGIVLSLDSVGGLLASRQFGIQGQNFDFQSMQITTDSSLVIFGSYNSANLILKTNLTADSGCYSASALFNADTLNWFPGASVGLTTFPVTVIDTSTITNSGFTVYDVCMSVGMNEKIVTNSFSVFPNPAKNELHIQQEKIEAGVINIYNVLGEIGMAAIINNQTQILDISILPSGTYFVELLQDDNIYFRKFVKE